VPVRMPQMTRNGTSVHPTSMVDPGATLGERVTVAPFVVIHANVVLGDGSFVDSHTVLGAPAADYYAAPGDYVGQPCVIGSRAIVRSHSIVYAGVEIGDEFECGHGVTVREGTRIGRGVRVGTRSDLQGDSTIGDYTRLHSNVFVAQKTTVESLVWLLPYVVLANDPHPPSDTCTVGPTIRRYAVVGTGATVFPAVEIGEGALVGAMTLVREDVPRDSVVAGVPGRVIGPTSGVACREGKLDRVYPWWTHFRRGYPEGVLPASDHLET
jgi:acetyltransferase-like isoleucine patch superfamily enzyme